MPRSRTRAAGLLASLLLLSACAAGEASAERPDAAAPGYRAPSGAPELCGRLAGAVHFTGIPHAVGRLAAGTGVPQARSALTDARDELRALTAELPTSADRELSAAVDDLAAALRAVVDAPRDDDARAGLVVEMDQLVAELQPVCGYPS